MHGKIRSQRNFNNVDNQSSGKLLSNRRAQGTVIMMDAIAAEVAALRKEIEEHNSAIMYWMIR